MAYLYTISTPYNNAVLIRNEILWVACDKGIELYNLLKAHEWATGRVIDTDWPRPSDADFVLPQGSAALHLYLSTYDYS